MTQPARILLVSYGGGHIEMCLPVMRAIRECLPDSEVRVMALTTAFNAARAAGEQPLGFRDFIALPGGRRALFYGAKLLSLSDAPHPAVSREESIAYLGFNFLEWVDRDGEALAWERWKREGRHAFLPVDFFRKVLCKMRTDVVLTTNSPRSERAAVEAAVGLGIPCLSMLDLFALPGDPFLRRVIYADRLTVLSEKTRDNLIAAGIDAPKVFVTGNPAFDCLATDNAEALGKAWRAARDWCHQNIVLWAGHLEAEQSQPAVLAGSGLGDQLLRQLVEWIEARPSACLAVRYHPNEWHAFAPPPSHPRIHWSHPEKEPLLPLLMAADQVVVQVTTVGVQAHIAGKRVINIGYSPYVLSSALDYSQLGVSERADNPGMLTALLDQGLVGAPQLRSNGVKNGNAARAVALHACALFKERAIR